MRRNSRSESRSGNNSVIYQNLSAANGQQLQYYQNEFAGHFKNSRAAQPVKSDTEQPKRVQKMPSGHHRNSRSITNNLGLTAPHAKSLIQGSQSSSFL